MPLAFICTFDKNPLAFNRNLVLIGDPAFISVLYKWQNTGTCQSEKLMLI